MVSQTHIFRFAWLCLCGSAPIVCKEMSASSQSNIFRFCLIVFVWFNSDILQRNVVFITIEHISVLRERACVFQIFCREMLSSLQSNIFRFRLIVFVWLRNMLQRHNVFTAIEHTSVLHDYVCVVQLPLVATECRLRRNRTYVCFAWLCLCVSIYMS